MNLSRRPAMEQVLKQHLAAADEPSVASSRRRVLFGLLATGAVGAAAYYGAHPAEFTRKVAELAKGGTVTMAWVTLMDQMGMEEKIFAEMGIEHPSLKGKGAAPQPPHAAMHPAGFQMA